MSELEKYIYNSAMEIMPSIIEKIKDIEVKARYIEIPFMCGACIDSLLYDVKEKRFIKIKYDYGIGKKMTLEGFDKYSGYFDDYERREIIIQ